MVRKDPGLTEADGRFVISVVFKGMATHHLLEQAHPGAAFTLNHSSTDDDITNLEKAIRYLYEEHANWPLKLSAAFFTSELSDGDGADGPPKINRLGSIKLTKKEQSSEGGELTGLLGARQVSLRFYFYLFYVYITVVIGLSGNSRRVILRALGRVRGRALGLLGS